jgi:hypothetical protein
VKKKIIALAAALMMFMGVVSASSINGDYKGNPIVKVMSNGKQLESDEVPAMIYDGHTVVPISLLRQIGASVEWNTDTYSVDVKMPVQENNKDINNNGREIRKYAILADVFKLHQDLSSEIADYSTTISLYFQGESNNYNNRMSDDDLNNTLRKIIDDFNVMTSTINSIDSYIAPLSKSRLSDALQINFNAIESYKKATKNIIDWKYTRRSQTEFDSYLRNSNDGNTLARQARELSKNGYSENISYVVKSTN